MGRGFAVVADEVRKLAKLSHQSTQNIEGIVAQLRQEAHRAVQVMNGARDTAARRSHQLEEAVGGLDHIVARVFLVSQVAGNQVDVQMRHALPAAR